MKKINPVGITTIVFAAFLIVTGLASAIFDRPSSAEKEQARRERRQAYATTMEFYRLRHASQPEAVWFKVGATSPQELEVINRNFARMQQSISQILQLHGGVTPLAREIKEAFPNLLVCLVTDGDKPFSHGNFDLYGKKGTLTVLFFPMEQMPPGKTMLSFDRDMGAILMACMNLPRALQAGVFMHEAGHALRFAQGAASANQTSRTDLYLQEEVEMHELEDRVIDAETVGKYAALVNRIVARAEDAEEAVDAVYQITLEDLTELDRIMECETVGERVAGFLQFQFGMSVACRWVDLHQQGATGKKIEYMRHFDKK